MPKDEAKVEGFVVLSRLLQARAPIQVLLLVSTRVPTPKTLNPKPLTAKTQNSTQGLLCPSSQPKLLCVRREKPATDRLSEGLGFDALGPGGSRPSTLTLGFGDLGFGLRV